MRWQSRAPYHSSGVHAAIWHVRLRVAPLLREMASCGQPPIPEGSVPISEARTWPKVFIHLRHILHRLKTSETCTCPEQRRLTYTLKLSLWRPSPYSDVWASDTSYIFRVTLRCCDLRGGSHPRNAGAKPLPSHASSPGSKLTLISLKGDGSTLSDLST